MKQLSVLSKKAMLFLASLFTTFVAAAQDATLDVNIDGPGDGGGAFYTQIWFWVVAGLVFILLLVALLRGGSKNQ